MMKTEVPVCFVGLEVANINFLWLYFIKSELHYGPFEPLRNSLILTDDVKI